MKLGYAKALVVGSSPIAPILRRDRFWITLSILLVIYLRNP